MTPRIISLVPSITLLLYDLGLKKNIVGKTKFCIHPKQINSIPTVGGTKTVDLQKVRDLYPDLIIANREENEKEQIEALQQDYNVIVTDVKNLDDNYRMIEEIGRLTNTEVKAAEIIHKTKAGFSKLKICNSGFSNSHINTLYLIWRNPFMTIGNDTFIHSVLETIGLKNIFESDTRYPVINDLQILSTSNCQLVLLSSEPYPFTEKHIAEIQQQLPGARILLVDGEYFSWYGSKMMHAPEYFENLLSIIKN